MGIMPNETTEPKRRFVPACFSIAPRVTTRRKVAFAGLALAALPLGWVVAARAQQFGMGLGIGAGEPTMARYVTAGDDAFLLGEPELLAGPRVTQVSVSPDERYAFAVRERTDLSVAASALASGGKPDGEYGEISLITWNRRTHRASVAWKAPRAANLVTQIQGAEWLPGTSSLLATIIQTNNATGDATKGEASLWLLNAVNGSARKVTTVTGLESGFVSSSGVAAVTTSSPEMFSEAKKATVADVVRVIKSDGTLKAPVSLPPGSGLYYISRDGGTLYSLYFRRVKDEKTGKFTTQRTFYAVSATSGAARELPGKPDLPDNEAEAQENELKAQAAALPVALADGEGTARRGAGVSQNLLSVWLTSLGQTTAPSPAAAPTKTAAVTTTTTTTTNGKPAAPASVTAEAYMTAVLFPQAALVVADADTQELTRDSANRRSWNESAKTDAHGARLLADGSAVLYRDRSGALYVRPIVRVNTSAFVEARKAALRTQSLSNAKQIALGILMYGQDYDEMYPPSGGATQSQISPYLKNEDLFKNTLTGQPAFTYVGGGSMAAIEEVAKTPIGYLAGPGGRVIIYADGHVKWE